MVYRAFGCTGKIGYLNKAVSATRDDINPTAPLMNRPTFLSIILRLSTCLNLLGHTEDLRELMRLLPVVASHPY